MVGIELTELVRRVFAGDRTAFQGLVEETSATTFRLAARIVGSTSEAEDVLQEAYLKAFRALSDARFEGRADVRTWLYRIVTHAAIDVLRRRRRDERLSDAPHPAPATSGSTLEAHIALRELAGWLDALPAEQRAALVLTSLEGLSNAEAASVLDCSEGALEQRLIRARAALRNRRDRDGS